MASIMPAPALPMALLQTQLVGSKGRGVWSLRSLRSLGSLIHLPPPSNHWAHLSSTGRLPGSYYPSRSGGHRHVHHFLNCHLHLSPLCNTRWLKYPWYLRTYLCDFNFILRIQFYFCAPCVSSGGAGRKRENILLYGKYLKIMVFDY